MRILLLIIAITFLLSGCYNPNKDKSKEQYEMGMFLLNTVDSTGNIDYASALPHFSESIALEKTNIRSYYWKMQCEFNMGLADSAIKTSQAAINLKHHNLTPQFHTAIGLVERLRGNEAIAIKSFTTASTILDKQIEDDDEDMEAIMNKAIVLCYLGQKDKALEFIASKKNDENIEDIDQLIESTNDFDADSLLVNFQSDK